MDQSGFVVGIDLGTSKITGVVGRKNEQGVITILASEIIPSDSCVRYGVIYNIDEAVGKIKKLISLLENKIGKKIGKAYVSVAGKSLRAIEHTEIKTQDNKMPITFAVLDEMEQKAKQNKPDFFTNYSVLSPEYYLDGQHEEDAMDKQASTIEVRYRLIIGRPNIKSNLQKSMDKAQTEIAGFIVGPVAAGALVLDPTDRESGCALVDFGAGSTTVSVYKGGLLRYMSVIPFGGRTITKDVQALGFVYESAESYKIRYGKLGKRDKKSSVVNSDVDLRELNKVIQLRSDEILLNVMHQIKESGFSDELEAGIIVTGGASQLNGLTEYFAEKSGLPVRKAGAKRVYINNAADLLQNPVYTQSLSLLLFANENCEKKEKAPEPKQIQDDNDNQVEDIVEKPENKKKKKKEEKEKQPGPLFRLFEKMQNFGGTMFDDEE